MMRTKTHRREILSGRVLSDKGYLSITCFSKVLYNSFSPVVYGRQKYSYDDREAYLKCQDLR